MLIDRVVTALIVCVPYLHGGAFGGFWVVPRLLGFGGAAGIAWRVTPLRG